MSDPVVEARFAAPPAAVLASLIAHVSAQGGQLDGVGGFGSEVTWRAFDHHVELVTLRAEVAADPATGLTHLLVRRVDVALEAALDCRPPAPADHRDLDARDAG